jgi:putative effector of murein hydrolase
VGISTVIGGIPSLTVCATIVTGIFGAMVGPTVMKLFRVQHDVSRGLALGITGTTAHGAVVQQALQANQTQGAMAGLSVGVVHESPGLLTPNEKLYLRPELD